MCLSIDTDVDWRKWMQLTTRCVSVWRILQIKCRRGKHKLLKMQMMICLSLFQYRHSFGDRLGKCAGWAKPRKLIDWFIFGNVTCKWSAVLCECYLSSHINVKYWCIFVYIRAFYTFVTLEKAISWYHEMKFKYACKRILSLDKI